MCSAAGNLWHEPWMLTTDSGQPYRVFASFWRKQRAQLPDAAPLPVAHAREWLRPPGSLPTTALNLLPKIRWDAGLADTWTPGEVGAQALARSRELLFRSILPPPVEQLSAGAAFAG